MYFHYWVTFKGYIRCFHAITSHDLVTLTLPFWPREWLVYSAPYDRPTYQFLLSYDYRLLSMNYWILSHFLIWNSHCACAVSRDLSSGAKGQERSTFLKSLTPIYLFTLSLSGRYDEDWAMLLAKIAFIPLWMLQSSLRMRSITWTVHRGPPKPHMTILTPICLFTIQLLWDYDDD